VCPRIMMHSDVSRGNQEMTWLGQKYLPETPNLGFFSSINVIPFSQNSLLLAGAAFREGDQHQGLLRLRHQVDGPTTHSRHTHLW
jgi:hypothetical protein